MWSFNIFEVFDQRTLDNDSMTVEDGGDCVPSWSQSEVDLRDQRTDNMQGGRSSPKMDFLKSLSFLGWQWRVNSKMSFLCLGKTP